MPGQSNHPRSDASPVSEGVPKFIQEQEAQGWYALVRVLLYLKGTDNFGLIHGAGGKNIYGFMDASYARCPDTRKSRSGGLLLLT